MTNRQLRSDNISEIELCDDNDCDDLGNDVNQCIIYNDVGKDGELWYRCTLCGIWAHSECSGVDTERLSL